MVTYVCFFRGRSDGRKRGKVRGGNEMNRGGNEMTRGGDEMTRGGNEMTRGGNAPPYSFKADVSRRKCRQYFSTLPSKVLNLCKYLGIFKKMKSTKEKTAVPSFGFSVCPEEQRDANEGTAGARRDDVVRVW